MNARRHTLRKRLRCERAKKKYLKIASGPYLSIQCGECGAIPVVSRVELNAPEVSRKIRYPGVHPRGKAW